MKIIIEKELDELWATPEQFAGMTDEEVIEFCQEDVCDLLDDALWTIIRNEDERMEK